MRPERIACALAVSALLAASTGLTTWGPALSTTKRCGKLPKLPSLASERIKIPAPRRAVQRGLAFEENAASFTQFDARAQSGHRCDSGPLRAIRRSEKQRLLETKMRG